MMNAVSPGSGVDPVLSRWRREAADVVMWVCVGVHLPAFLAIMYGWASLMAPLAKVISLVCYLSIVLCAAFPRTDFRLRLAVFFAAMYAAAVMTNLAVPTGPYAHTAVIAIPVLALVLHGARAAKAAGFISFAIIAGSPPLRGLPAVIHAFAIDPAQEIRPVYLIWTQTVVMCCILLATIFVLIRFHRFLLQTLAAERRALRQVEHEAARRRTLEREISAISDGERRRLGHEIHDGVSQLITAALMHCRLLERSIAPGEAGFAALSRLLKEAVDEAHNVAEGLCPLGSDPQSLVQALRALARRTGEATCRPCEFVCSGELSVPDPDTAQHLYRIAQEALSNAARHAHAGRIVLELRGSPGELLLQVEDDGIGLPDPLPAGGMGLRTMACRAGILEGELSLTPRPGGGARVSCRAPRRAGAFRSTEVCQ
jgi:signal transduction histidine kinase